VDGPTVSPQDEFDFRDFACKIYAEKPRIYLAPSPVREGEEFLLPALYGGVADHGKTFAALVVLEGLSEPFTKARWKTQCATPEEAINQHRKIFFQWAFRGPQARLFLGLVGEPSTVEDFFRQLYITDVWKDGAFKANRKGCNPAYERYWRSKLALEIKGVAADRAIFVGGPAREVGWDLVPSGMPRHDVPFPAYRNANFVPRLQQLFQEIRGEGFGECSSSQPTDTEYKKANDEVGVVPTRYWTLNDTINHHKFGVIPNSQPRIRMELSYQTSPATTKVHVTSLLLVMDDLLKDCLVRKVKGGFWLRFVHDVPSHTIRIQLNQHSPSQFVVKLSPSVR
jgi:hypothetical protein